MCSEGMPCLQSRVGSVIKALQPILDVLSWNAKRLFSETNSVVSNVQNNVNVLLYLHGVLVSNKLNTCGLLTISRYIYGLCWFFPACMTIAFKQALFGSPHRRHRSLDCLLLTFHGSEGSSVIPSEVVCQALSHSHLISTLMYDFCSNNLSTA